MCLGNCILHCINYHLKQLFSALFSGEALTSGCILGLKNKPGVEYKFHKFYTANVADLKDLKTGERHLVNVAGLSKGVLILRGKRLRINLGFACIQVLCSSINWQYHFQQQ